MSAIDKMVEPLVRKALSAAVAKSAEGMKQALQAMSVTPTLSQQCFALTSAVASFQLLDMYDGPVTEGELQELASSCVAMESWANPTVAVVLPYLRTLAWQQPLPTEHLDAVFRLSFVVTGWLLSAFNGEDQPWFGLLDDVLAQLEAAQGKA